MGKKNKSSKRKTREIEADAEVLSHKSLGEKDGVDLMDDLSEPTMGEKLASLKLEGDDKASNDNNVDSSLAKPPSADSVYILLKQALRADDRALLIACLYRQDAKVQVVAVFFFNDCLLSFCDYKFTIVVESFRCSQVLQSLVSIIQLRSLLLLHASSIMSQESSLAVLNSLYQLIESRVSTFNNALQLSSCLDLLYAETIDDGVEENTPVTPIIYEDEDESDDDGFEDYGS
ncbi:hypothetical protein Sango_1810000 [Sesamum angolense]|uniref:Small-subunit processome Utp12 domain-containing protein n=1 Tax=Sesamum angolense TaxID=2727404 RepID=A0AAE2BPU3_9LAMI|nr:hypothetical protein Sango_1810000 [Sesamum angolense]